MNRTELEGPWTWGQKLVDRTAESEVSMGRTRGTSSYSIVGNEDDDICPCQGLPSRRSDLSRADFLAAPHGVSYMWMLSNSLSNACWFK